MVTFFLVNPKRTVSSIAILISFNGETYRRSTGESVPVKFWSKAKKRAKVTADFQHGHFVNEILNKWESAGMRTMVYFKEFYNPPDSRTFFEKLNKEYYLDGGEQKREEVLFADYFDTYINRYKNVRSAVLIQQYRIAQNKIRQYEEKRRRKLKFENLTIDFYNDFRCWFYEQGYSDNYFGSFIKRIKQVYREANKVDKLHSYDDIEHKDFITVNQTSDNIYLNEDELNAIYTLDINESLINTYYPKLLPHKVSIKINSLKLSRDRFLIGAYTGLRVSDFGRLKDINIGEYIRITTTKTGTDTIIPIHPILKEIFASGFDANITISDQKINTHIKEVALLAGITDIVVLNKHIAGKLEQVCEPKYKLVCTHTARRSFATNAYKAGVPTIAIMKITGHRQESTFLKYIKISAQENADILNTHPFFNNK